MTNNLFVPIIPGAIDDQARDANLSGGATGLYRLLCEHADRLTGVIYPVTVAELADLSRYSRNSVKGYLDDLHEAELIVSELHQGHYGKITITRHTEVVWQKTRSRKSDQRSRNFDHRSRNFEHGSRQSARANRGNAPKREEDRRSSTFSPSGAPDGAGAPGSPTPSPPAVCEFCNGLPLAEPCEFCTDKEAGSSAVPDFVPEAWVEMTDEELLADWASQSEFYEERITPKETDQ